MMDEKLTRQAEGIKSKVDEMTTRNFTISGCPEKVFMEFTAYSKKEVANCYWMAIKQLLDLVNINAKETVLYEKISTMDDRLKVIENKEFTPEVNGGSKVRTFGKRTEDKKDE